MVWSAIQEVRTEKKELHVIWLDLANAHDSVPHKLIEKAMDFFYIPEHVQTLIRQYYAQFHMRFITKEYTTTWQPLEVGIPMGCTIPPLLFVLAIEMVVRGTECSAKGLETPENVVLLPMRTVMDDITSLTRGAEETARLLQQLEELIAWACMAFKPKKSRSLSLQFRIAGEQIPMVADQSRASKGGTPYP